MYKRQALHAGQVFTKEQLYDAVFGFDAGGDPSAIAEHVKNIRAKLKDEGLSPVETVWGVGYKWQKNSVQMCIRDRFRIMPLINIQYTDTYLQTGHILSLHKRIRQL